MIRNGEKRYVAWGRTEQGRALEIVYTKRKSNVRIISAWESRKVRALFEEENQDLKH